MQWFMIMFQGEEMARHTTVTVDAPRDFLPLFVRGGYIIPTQEPANNTVHRYCTVESVSVFFHII